MSSVPDVITGYRNGFTERNFAVQGCSRQSTRKAAVCGLGGFDLSAEIDLSPTLVQSALSGFVKRTGNLAASLQSFRFPPGTAADQLRTAVVSDARKADAVALPGASPATYRLDIDRLEQVLTVTSSPLQADAPAVLEEGSHSFNLTISTTTHTITITVSKSGVQTDSNRDLLEQISRAVSSADSRLEAGVTTSSRKVHSQLSDGLTENTAYLTVTRRDPEDDVDFRFSDVAGETLVEELGLDSITRSGETAACTINSSSCNPRGNLVFSDDNTLALLLRGVTDDPVIVQVRQGPEPVIEEITRIVGEYNEFIEWIHDNRRFISQGLREDLKMLTAGMAEDLKDTGIIVDAGGTLTVTENLEGRLSVDVSAVRERIAGEEGLFPLLASRLSRVLENDPRQYLVQSGVPRLYGTLSIFA